MHFLNIIKNLFTRNELIKLSVFFFLSILSPILELLSLGSLVALIVFLLDKEKFNQIFNFSLSDIEIFGLTSSGQVTTILLTIVISFIIKNLYLFYYSYFETSLRYNILSSKSKILYKSYFNSSYIYFKSFNRADIFNNVMVETGRVLQYIFSLITIIRESFLAIILMFSIFYINKFYSLVLFIILTGISIFLFLLLNKKFIMIGNALRKITKNLISIIQETQNLFKIMIFKEKKYFFYNKFDKLINSRTKNFIKQELFKKSSRFIFETVIILVVCGILYFHSKNENNIRELLPFLSILALISIKLLPTFSNINSMLSSIKFSEASFYNYLKILKDLKNNQEDLEYQNQKKIKISDLENLIISNLSFSYEKRRVLKEVNFKINKGEIFGIFGKSGSGKSTLVDLISGLLRPQAGKILFNNTTNIFHCLKSWQNLIGYVPQENLLMNDSLKNNICLGVVEEKINQSKLDEVIEITALNEVILNLKDGIETILGDSGNKISGGQKQRIAIARALYMDTKLLIFDEATSALDSLAQEKILRIIQNSKKEKMIILISHDLSLKKICDNTLEL